MNNIEKVIIACVTLTLAAWIPHHFWSQKYYKLENKCNYFESRYESDYKIIAAACSVIGGQTITHNGVNYHFFKEGGVLVLASNQIVTTATQFSEKPKTNVVYFWEFYDTNYIRK